MTCEGDTLLVLDFLRGDSNLTEIQERYDRTYREVREIFRGLGAEDLTALRRATWSSDDPHCVRCGMILGVEGAEQNPAGEYLCDVCYADLWAGIRHVEDLPEPLAEYLLAMG